MRKLGFLLVVVVFLGSCTLITGHQNVAAAPSNGDIAAFQKSFMSSYYVARAGAPLGAPNGPRALTPFSAHPASAAKATVPVNKLTNPAFASLSPLTFSDYPEPGQTTSFTAAVVAVASGGFNVYDMKVTTSFPASDARKTYFEEYFVEDSGVGVNDAGNWTINDPIVEGSGSAWTQNQSARVSMVLTFQDGSTRTETIVSQSSTALGTNFLDPSAFGIGGSLDMSQVFVPNKVTFYAHPSSGVQYSSVVMYYVTPATSYNYWFWAGSSQQTILGIRYYTEVADAGANTYTAYTASFEKTIGTLTTTGGSFTSTLATVYAGSKFDTLAESVLRQQVVYGLDSTTSGSTTYYVPTGTGAITTNMQTRVVNIAGLKDFYLQQLNSDYATMTGSLASTLYIPTGSATAILAGDPSQGVFTRDQQITPAAGTLPFAVSTSDKASLGDLGTVFASITEGAYAAPIANPPPANTNIMPANTEWNFSGQQVVGSSINPASLPALTTSGTVEVWLYINTMTDTMGIVHKGTNPNFSDEAYSLQGWYNNGQIAMLVDRSGSYDAAYSDINLNTQCWYYIVGTWDVTNGNRYVNLYINGVLHGSGTPNVIYPSGTTDSTSIGMMVGSQIPSSYDSTYGYFGLNGKIVGVNISQTPMSAADILAKYNTYAGSTASW